MSGVRTLGIIAGEGRLPDARGTRGAAAGMRTVAIGLSGSVWPEVEAEVDVFRTVGLTRLGSWVRELRRNGVDETIMVGRVRKVQLYSRWSWVKYVPTPARCGCS